MDFRGSIRQFAEVPLNRQLLMDVLKDYKRPFAKINRLIKNGELIVLRRGLFVPGPKTNIAQPEPFLVANHLRGPSYISLESALSYWGLIPERVYEICSVTIKSTRIYKTEIGRFSYSHVPFPYYAFGIQSVRLSARQVVLIASPEKALCDKIILTSGILLRSIRQVHEFLIEDLRIDEEMLGNLDLEAISSWIEDAPKRRSLEMLVNAIKKL